MTDNKGSKVEVKPATIAAGETTAYFEFVTPATEQKGIWTIAGQKYNFDLAANLDAFKEADTQIALNKALADLGIKNVKAENVPTYLAEKDDFLAELEGDLSTDAIQTWVNKVNADIVSDTDKEEAENVATKAVVDALKAKNDIALLSALQNDVFKRVNSDWLMEYKAGFHTGAEGALVEPADAAAVQAVVNGVNEGKVKDAEAITDTIVDKTELAKEKVLLENYATPDAEGKQTQGTKDALEAIEIQNAVADVLASTTPNTLKTRVAALAKLTDAVDVEKYIDENGKYYLNGYGEDVAGLKGNTNVKGARAINTLLEDINEAVSGSYITAVNEAASADDLLKALKAYPGLKNVVDANKAFYFTPGEGEGAGNQFAEATSDDIQTLVDGANVAAVAGADNADKLLVALKNAGISNVVDANKAAYDTAAVNKDGNKYFEAVTTKDQAQKVVNAVNAYVVADQATSATELRTALINFAVALENLGGVAEAPDFINLSSQVKLEVAEIVLNEKEEGFTTAYVLGKAVDTAMTTHGNFLNGVNTADSISAVKTALDNEDVFPAFYALDAAAKVEKAEAVYNKLQELKSQDPASEFQTITAIKTAAGL